MYSSQRQLPNDQFRHSDVAPLSPAAQQALDLDSSHYPSDQYIATDPQRSNYSGLQAEPSPPSFGPSGFKGDPDARPSIGRRVSRTVARFVIAVLIGVGSTLAWQSYGDNAKRMVRTWAPSLGSLLPVSTASASASAAASLTSPELDRQLDPMARNIALVLFHLEQLAAKQEQMAKDIAALQAIEQDKQVLSVPPSPSSVIPVPPRKPATRSSAASPPALPGAPPSARSPLPLR